VFCSAQRGGLITGLQTYNSLADLEVITAIFGSDYANENSRYYENYDSIANYRLAMAAGVKLPAAQAAFAASGAGGEVERGSDTARPLSGFYPATSRSSGVADSLSRNASGSSTSRAAMWSGVDSTRPLNINVKRASTGGPGNPFAEDAHGAQMAGIGIGARTYVPAGPVPHLMPLPGHVQGAMAVPLPLPSTTPLPGAAPVSAYDAYRSQMKGFLPGQHPIPRGSLSLSNSVDPSEVVPRLKLSSTSAGEGAAPHRSKTSTPVPAEAAASASGATDSSATAAPSTRTSTPRRPPSQSGAVAHDATNGVSNDNNSSTRPSPSALQPDASTVIVQERRGSDASDSTGSIARAAAEVDAVTAAAQ
jgi:hypothetical protein